MPKTYTPAEMIDEIKHELDVYTEKLTSWKDEFMMSPAYAFEWSQRAFEVAARHETLAWTAGLAGSLAAAPDRTTQEIAEIICRELDRQIVRTAMYPARSTSPQSNIMHQERGAAAAWLIDQMIGRMAGRTRI